MTLILVILDVLFKPHVYRLDQETATMLLNKGADVDIAGGKYGFPLQAAARSGLETLVEKILEKSKDTLGTVNALGGIYGDALQAARKGPLSRKILGKITLGHMRYSESNPDVMRDCISSRSQDAESDYTKVVRLLTEIGAVIHTRSGRYENPINAAAGSGIPSLLEVLLKECIKSVSAAPKEASHHKPLQQGESDSRDQPSPPPQSAITAPRRKPVKPTGALCSQ